MYVNFKRTSYVSERVQSDFKKQTLNEKWFLASSDNKFQIPFNIGRRFPPLRFPNCICEFHALKKCVSWYLRLKTNILEIF